MHKEQPSFGTLLRHYRKSALPTEQEIVRSKKHERDVGLTQEEVAERAGMTSRQISNLEADGSMPPRATVERLIRALDLEPDGAQQLRRTAGTLGRRQQSSPSGAGQRAQAAELSAPLAAGNLPCPITSFVGRAREVVAVTDLLLQSRLLSLIGTGGVGKTRLALQIAAQEAVRQRYPHGVWLVELAPLGDPELVPHTVAQALGLRESQRGALSDRNAGARSDQSTHTDLLADTLAQRRLLLVLDNCEHLVAACAQLAERLLQRCPHLQILATSREPLGLAGEVTWRVPSLQLPEPDARPTAAALGEVEAVRLFVERARATQPRFTLSPATAPAVVEVCRRLDGIPLALELAATCLRGLSVAQLAGRLDRRFALLTGGQRTALPRQQTLAATVQWSFDRLSRAEQSLFTHLSVFAGAFTLEAAEAICAGGDVQAPDVLGLLLRLVDRSLVLAEEGADGATYDHLLETLRQFGATLLPADELRVLRDRHLGWYLTLAETAEPQLSGPEQAAWLARLEMDHDNLRAALRWAQERRAGTESLRLASALAPFWHRRGYRSEGRRWLEDALAGADELAGVPADDAARARCLHAAAGLAVTQGDYGRAKDLYDAALILYRSHPHWLGQADCLVGLGWIAYRQGDFARGAALMADGLVLGRQMEDMPAIASALRNLAGLAGERKDFDRATALYAESLGVMRALGDTAGIASVLTFAAAGALLHGEHERAVRAAEESLALSRTLDDAEGIAFALSTLGWVAQFELDHVRAATLLRESLDRSFAIGFREILLEALDSLAWSIGALGQPLLAARICGAAATYRRAVGFNYVPAFQVVYDAMMTCMRAELGEEPLRTAWSEGQCLALEDAVALALRAGADAIAAGQQAPRPMPTDADTWAPGQPVDIVCPWYRRDRQWLAAVMQRLGEGT